MIMQVSNQYQTNCKLKLRHAMKQKSYTSIAGSAGECAAEPGAGHHHQRTTAAVRQDTRYAQHLDSHPLAALATPLCAAGPLIRLRHVLPPSIFASACNTCTAAGQMNPPWPNAMSHRPCPWRFDWNPPPTHTHTHTQMPCHAPLPPLFSGCR